MTKCTQRGNGTNLQLLKNTSAVRHVLSILTYSVVQSKAAERQQ